MPFYREVLWRYILSFPLYIVNVTDSSVIAQRTNASLGMSLLSAAMSSRRSSKRMTATCLPMYLHV